MKISRRIQALAMLTVIISISCTGCGGCGSAEDSAEVNADNVVIESTIDAEEPETVVEEQANMGIEEPFTQEETPTQPPETTPTPAPEVNEVEIDTSMADIYYIITEDQNVYARPDVTSEVTAIYPIDTEITVSGIHVESGMFEIVDTNGAVIGYVNSGYCDLLKGGYQIDEDTAIPDEDTTTSPDYTQQGVQIPTKEEAQATLPSTFAGQPWYEALSPEEKAKVDHALQNTLSGNAYESQNDWSWADEFERGDDATADGNFSLGDCDFGQGDYSDIPEHSLD